MSECEVVIEGIIVSWIILKDKLVEKQRWCCESLGQEDDHSRKMVC